MFGPKLAAPVKCPSCGSEHGLELFESKRRAGRHVEATGKVTDCCECACRYTRLYAGGVIRFGGARQPLAATDAGGPTGGHGTGRPGGLDPDMVTFDTQLGPL